MIATANEATELTDELIDRVRRLSPEDRDRLFDLVDMPIGEGDPEVQAEMQRRWDNYEADPSIAIDGEVLLAELRARIEARKST